MIRRLVFRMVMEEKILECHRSCQFYVKEGVVRRKKLLVGFRSFSFTDLFSLLIWSINTYKHACAFEQVDMRIIFKSDLPITLYEMNFLAP